MGREVARKGTEGWWVVGYGCGDGNLHVCMQYIRSLWFRYGGILLCGRSRREGWGRLREWGMVEIKKGTGYRV